MFAELFLGQFGYPHSLDGRMQVLLFLWLSGHERGLVGLLVCVLLLGLGIGCHGKVPLGSVLRKEELLVLLLFDADDGEDDSDDQEERGRNYEGDQEVAVTARAVESALGGTDWVALVRYSYIVAAVVRVVLPILHAVAVVSLCAIYRIINNCNTRLVAAAGHLRVRRHSVCLLINYNNSYEWI